MSTVITPDNIDTITSNDTAHNRNLYFEFLGKLNNIADLISFSLDAEEIEQAFYDYDAQDINDVKAAMAREISEDDFNNTFLIDGKLDIKEFTIAYAIGGPKIDIVVFPGGEVSIKGYLNGEEFIINTHDTIGLFCCAQEQFESVISQ